MQCLYKTLDLLPTATDNEIRSAYRRCALSTHPDKGGSAEAFRSVVHAFKILVDASRRAAYDQLLRCRSKSSSTAPEKKAPPRNKRKAESSTSTAKPAVAKDKPKRAPAKDARAPKESPKQHKSQPPQNTEMNSNMGCNPMDHQELYRRLLRLLKKQALEELEKLSEEDLNAFAQFLASQEADEILSKLCESRRCKPRILALQDLPKTRKLSAVRAVSKKRFTNKTPKAPKRKTLVKTDANRPARAAKPLVKGISCNKRNNNYQTHICLCTNLMIMTQTVKDLGAAIDMHISLVQIRQHVEVGLEEGKDFRQVALDAMEAVRKERAAAGAEEMRLSFRSAFRKKYTLTTHDLDTAIQDWRRITGQQEPLSGLSIKALREQEKARKQAEKQAEREDQRAEKLERARQKLQQREWKLMARQRRQEQQQARLEARQKRHEELHGKRLAFARIKHGRLQAMVLALQARFQKIRRQKLLKSWGVPELPEGLQLSSFQSADDSLCATLRLSDGTEAVGPYRKNFQQAVRELRELRALQQHRGDEALQQEMQRRDVDAMTAFFVQSIS